MHAHLDVLIRHTNEIGICSQVLGCGHGSKLYRTLVAERFVGPFSDRPNFFDGCDAVVGYEDLRSEQISL